MPKSTINGCFYFKASHAQELMEDKTMQPIQVEVVKILQLTGQQFRDFSANLLRDMPFLIPNKKLTGYDKGRQEWEDALQILEGRQREYIEGLPWERKVAYHRLDLRMRGIAARLYEAGKYQGNCYFRKAEERVAVGGAPGMP